MPQFDLRHIQCAKYVNTGGTITYTNVQTVGDAMMATLELRYAEGRLFAESSLAEFMKKAVGGSVSLGTKYIPTSAQQLMYGSTSKSRSVTVDSATVSVSGVVIGAKSDPAYVGISFYCPDMVDGVLKYTCVFIPKALFGPPSMSFQTAGDSIQFQTPTTIGEFLASDASTQDMLEVAVADTEAAAIAWCAAVFA